MTGNCDSGRSWIKIVCLSFALFLGTGSMIAFGQNIDTSVPDRAYCVGTGNLYSTNPALNSGKPICQFLDGSWCDAREFFRGNCTGATSGYSGGLTSALDIASATRACQVRGGQVQNVHTVYGDVNLCVFPDGSSIDLGSLSRATYSGGVYEMPYIGYYGMPYSGSYALPDSTLYDESGWYYLAYLWLNAP